MKQQKEKHIPVVAFAAYSGTGKTTLIEKLIRNLKARGLRLAVIKHDAHHFDIDREGKDSWRFTHAGADMTIVSSPEKTAVIETRERTLYDNLSMIHDVDLILVEGYKNEEIPQIGICREAAGKGFVHPIERYLAVVTDCELPENAPKSFGLDEIDGICDFIAEYMQSDEAYQV